MKIVAIVNPQSGNGECRRTAKILKEKLAPSLVSVEQTSSPLRATEIARQAAAEKMDTVVVVGGDGTVHAAANGLVGSRTALGIIPTGTANDLARLCRIPVDVENACQVVVRGELRHIDVIGVNGRYFVTSGAVGLPCEAASFANRLKTSGPAGRWFGQLLGSQIYSLAALAALASNKWRLNRLRLESEGRLRTVDACACVVSNQSFLGRVFQVSPGARNDDGLFDVCLITSPQTRRDLWALAGRVRNGSHLRAPGVEAWKTSEMTLTAEEPTGFLADGETLEPKTPRFYIRIFPKALSVVVPQGNIEN